MDCRCRPLHPGIRKCATTMAMACFAWHTACNCKVYASLTGLRIGQTELILIRSRPPRIQLILSSALTDAGRQPKQTRILQGGPVRRARYVATCCRRPFNPKPPAAYQQARDGAAAATATAPGSARPCHLGIH